MREGHGGDRAARRSGCEHLGWRRLLQTHFTSCESDFTREGVKLEILIIDPLRFKSTKQILPATVLFTAFGLSCVRPPELGQTPSIIYGSLWFQEKRVLSHRKLKPMVKAQDYYAPSPHSGLFPSLLVPSWWETTFPHPLSPIFSLIQVPTERPCPPALERT